MIGQILRMVIFNIILSGMLFLCFSQNYIPPPNSPLANGEHPRLIFTNSKLQNNIQPYITNYEITDFETWIDDMDAVYSNSISNKKNRDVKQDAFNFAFLSFCLESGYFSNFSNFSYTASQYAKKAYDHIIELGSRNLWEHGSYDEQKLTKGTEGWGATLPPAVVYDWCYNNLTIQQKKDIADVMIEFWDNSLPHSDPSNTHGAVKGELWKVLGGFTWYGDDLGSYYDNYAQQMLDRYEYAVEDRILKYVEQMSDGSWGFPSGMSYTGEYMFHHAMLMSALGPALGYNFLEQYPHLQDMGLYLFNAFDPTSVYSNENGYHHRVQKFEVGSFRKSNEIYYRFVFQTIGYLFKEVNVDLAGFYKWILNDSYLSVGMDTWEDEGKHVWGWAKFLHGLKDIDSKTPEQSNIAKSKRFGEGRTWMWSEFSERATKVYMEAPTFTWKTHNNVDRAQFMIWKRGNLTPDMGHNKAGLSVSFSSGAARMPIWHNRLNLYNDSNHGYEYDEADLNYEAFYNHPNNQPGGENQVGSIIGKDLEGENYDFIDYDYTLEYDDEPDISFIRRALLYIRDPNVPNYTNQEWVIIYDSVETNTNNYKRRWTCHAPEKPVLTNGSWNLQSDKSYIGTGNTLKITAAKQGVSDSLNGRMFLKILKPDNYDLLMRGGKVGGNNYEYAKANMSTGHVNRADYSNWTDFHAGAYTYEIEHSVGKNSTFLTVFQICNDTTYNSMSSVTEISTVNFLGALLDENRIAFFNKSINPASSISYNFSSNKVVKHFITGLKKGNYDVIADGNLLANIKVDKDNGVLYFESNGGGNFSITQITDIGVLNNHLPEGYKLYQNYPNPFNPSTMIIYQLPKDSDVQLITYDLLGKQIKKLVNKQQNAGEYQIEWDGLDETGKPVASGIYLYQLIAGDFSEVRKMILMK